MIFQKTKKSWTFTHLPPGSCVILVSPVLLGVDFAAKAAYQPGDPDIQYLFLGQLVQVPNSRRMLCRKVVLSFSWGQGLGAAGGLGSNKTHLL